MAGRPSTPPPQAWSRTDSQAKSPITPEQVRQTELARLRAKALREQREAQQSRPLQNGQSKYDSSSTPRSDGSAPQKRPFSAISTSSVPTNQRDARGSSTPSSANARGPFRPLDEIQPARNFAKYVEYDFSKMTDTKGGFLTAEDDPHNKVLHATSAEEKPATMTLKDWERQQLLRSLRDQKAGPFEPGLSVLGDGKDQKKKCRECGSLEIDWKWDDIFKCSVCNSCKEKYPEKYSLLTKTEAREDYLLTDPELKDEELLPHLERPNPHKSTWNNMMLYLRYQVEEYAFAQKWGSEEQMDEEYQRREAGKKKRKEDKFKSKLQELKKKTRVEAWRRNRARNGERGTKFGDEVDRGGKHTHVFGRALDKEEGIGQKTCVECGMEVEEMEF